jgi:hypothetical protein
VFGGMPRSGSLLLYDILEESPSKDDSSSSEGESSGSPLLRECERMISVTTIMTTPLSEETLTF